jgi:NAD(P)-dependent dehydrogenase (short-subunit alcohol dehydrogenase family)
LYKYVPETPNDVFGIHFRNIDSRPEKVSRAMLNVLVTGAARGLGLELVKRYSLQLPDNGLVIATSRKSSPDLEELVCDCKSKVFFVEMDISSEESILQSVETVKSLLPGKALDILINNAGVHSWTNGGISEM